MAIVEDYEDAGFDKYMSNRAKPKGRNYTKAELNTPIQLSKTRQEIRGLLINEILIGEIVGFSFESSVYNEYVGSKSIPHNLGYVPVFEVFFKLEDTDNYSKLPYFEYPTSPQGVADDQTSVFCYADEDNITVVARIGQDVYTGNPYPFKYYIYRNELER